MKFPSPGSSRSLPHGTTMIITPAIYALLAPTLAYAAAFQWSLPEPTAFVPAADNWSPAPTAAPQLPNFDLFKRQSGEGGKTCAFISGLSGIYLHLTQTQLTPHTNIHRIINNMLQHQLRLRNQYPLRRPWLLRPCFNECLHDSNNMHRRHRPTLSLHRCFVFQ